MPATSSSSSAASKWLAKMEVLLLLAVVSVASGCSSSDNTYDEFKIMRKTKENELMVAVDEDAKLHCMTNVPWKKCVWKPPRNGVREVSCLNAAPISPTPSFTLQSLYNVDVICSSPLNLSQIS